MNHFIFLQFALWKQSHIRQHMKVRQRARFMKGTVSSKWPSKLCGPEHFQVIHGAAVVRILLVFEQ